MFFGKMGWKRGYGERLHKSVAPFMKASGRGARNMGMGGLASSVTSVTPGRGRIEGSKINQGLMKSAWQKSWPLPHRSLKSLSDN